MYLAYWAEITAGRPIREAFEDAVRLGLGHLDLTLAAPSGRVLLPSAGDGWIACGQEDLGGLPWRGLALGSWGALADTLLSLMAEFRVRVAAMGASLGGPLHAAGRARRAAVWREFLDLLEVACACGVPTLTIRADPTPARLGVREIYFRTGRLLGPMTEAALERGIALCVEASPRSLFAFPAQAMLLLEACPGLRFTYEPQVFVAAHIPLLATDPLFGRTGHVRLRDAGPGGRPVGWGRGAVDPGWLVGRLAFYGYRGAVAVGGAVGGGGLRPVEEARRAVREVRFLRRVGLCVETAANPA